MEPQDKLSPITSLEQNIRKFQAKIAPVSAPVQPTGVRMALKMGLEVIVGVLVGAGVGMLLDKWLGTSPVLCILCFFLGAGGGFLNLYRAMQATDKTVATNAPVTADDEDD